MAGHEHTRRCYWDFHDARWVCRAARAEDDPVAEFPAVVVPAAASLPVGATVPGAVQALPTSVR